MYSLEDCGKRIRELRKDRGMSQDALAESLGMTQQGIANLEAGRRGPSIDSLLAVAEFFGVSLDYLILGRFVVEVESAYNPYKVMVSKKILQAVLDCL